MNTDTPNSKYPRTFHVLDLPDKSRVTLEVIEAPHAFFITLRLPNPQRKRSKNARLARKWMEEVLAHTTFDPRPNIEKIYIGNRLAYDGISKIGGFVGFAFPIGKGTIFS